MYQVNKSHFKIRWKLSRNYDKKKIIHHFDQSLHDTWASLLVYKINATRTKKCRKPDRSSHPDQYNIRRFNGDVGPGPDRDAHVGLGQGRRIVDAIAHHGHFLAVLLQLLYFSDLVRRQDLGVHLPDAGLGGGVKIYRCYQRGGGLPGTLHKTRGLPTPLSSLAFSGANL